MARGWMLPSMLATTCFLAGCSQTSTTLIAGTEARIVSDTCRRAWRPISWSSRDTEQTQIEVRAGNAARKAYCRGVK